MLHITFFATAIGPSTTQPFGYWASKLISPLLFRATLDSFLRAVYGTDGTVHTHNVWFPKGHDTLRHFTALILDKHRDKRIWYIMKSGNKLTGADMWFTSNSHLIASFKQRFPLTSLTSVRNVSAEPSSQLCATMRWTWKLEILTLCHNVSHRFTPVELEKVIFFDVHAVWICLALSWRNGF